MEPAHASVYDHLSRLIAIKSISGDELAADQIVMYCGSILQDANMHVTMFNDGGFPSLVATSRPHSKKPKLLLAAHLDVVPADDKMFELKREDGRLYGRGVLDMKFAAACFLTTAQTLAKELAGYDFGIMLTTDEETTGEHGVGYLLKEGYGAEVCLLPDGANNWRVEAMAKGSWQLSAIAKGKTAHGSQPWAGESATDKLLGFLYEAKRLIPTPQEHTGTTMVVSQLQAGKAPNQIPDFASSSLDIRFLGSNTKEELEKMLSAAAHANGVELKTMMYAQPVELDLSLPALQIWEDIVEKIRGEPNDDYALSFGASDARYFSLYDIPSIITYPTGEGTHSDHEWISEKDLYNFYECTLAYVKAVAAK